MQLPYNEKVSIVCMIVMGRIRERMRVLID